MTQDTAHMPLDERALEAAREQPGTNHDGIIRAYLQTAAADVSGLARSIDRWRNMVPVAVTAGSPAQIEYALADAKHDIIALWSTLQTLSASNAALEAEIERLRAENEWQPIETAPVNGPNFIARVVDRVDEYDEDDRLIQRGKRVESAVIAQCVSFTGDRGEVVEVPWKFVKGRDYTGWRPLPALSAPKGGEDD